MRRRERWGNCKESAGAPSVCEAGGSPVLAAVHAASSLSARRDPENEPRIDADFLEQMSLADTVTHWVRIADGLAQERRYA